MEKVELAQGLSIAVEEVAGAEQRHPKEQKRLETKAVHQPTRAEHEQRSGEKGDGVAGLELATLQPSSLSSDSSKTVRPELIIPLLVVTTKSARKATSHE